MMKICNICNIEQELSEYYKTCNYCKSCNKIKTTCEHGIRKYICKICIKIKKEKKLENKLLKNCNLCNIKKQNTDFYKNRNYCKECFIIKQKCIHNINNNDCKICSVNSFCVHKKRKDKCIICYPNSNAFCKKCKIYHASKKNNYLCYSCNPIIKQICTHKKRKDHCRICYPESNRFCKYCKLYIVKKENNYLCSDCDPNRSKREKTKELTIKQLLTDNGYEFIHNNQIYNDCNYKYFPDFRFNCLTYYIILEVDEEAHKSKSYNDDCEKIRMNNISLSLDLPVKFIRYNPDNKEYTKQEKEIKLIEILDKYINLEELDNIEPIYLFY